MSGFAVLWRGPISGGSDSDVPGGDSGAAGGGGAVAGSLEGGAAVAAAGGEGVSPPAGETSSSTPASESGAVAAEGSPEGSAGDHAGDQAMEISALRSEVEASRRQAVESHRRALLAENAGQVVGDLVAGDTVEALDASVALARSAFESVRAATLAGLAASSGVGAGNAQRGDAIDIEGLSPVQKIAHGLRPARE